MNNIICEVCKKSEFLTEVLNLGLHPMCDDLKPIDSVEKCEEFPIVIDFCNNCYTAHQRFQIPKQKLFPTSYHYRSRFTADVLSGMKDLVENVCQIKAVEGKKVIDIGCNDGSLLDFFKMRGAITFGIEPTDACKEALIKGHFTRQEFFTEEGANNLVKETGKFDIITFTNVFAHIENLDEVLKAIKTLMKENSILVIENHYLGAVLSKNQFDTFYHEHPRTYSLNSFFHISKSLGLSILSTKFPSRYGGNIQVILGIPNGDEINFNFRDIIKSEDEFLKNFHEIRTFIGKWKIEKRKEIDLIFERHGKIKAKAFPGRAAILIKLLNLDESVIECVYEKPGSMKIGHYVPGTKIMIKSDEELFEKINSIAIILNLAWHIPSEIKIYLEEHGYSGQIVNIL